METINDRIRIVMKEKCKNQTEMAKLINISQPNLSKICTGAMNPTDRIISDICRVFDVSETWLRYGEGRMPVERSMNQELAIMVNELMSEADDSFRKRFVSALLDLPPQLWPELEKFIKKISQDE